MPPDLALLSTLIGSNYPCLELIFIVPKMFQPLKFECIYIRFNQNLDEQAYISAIIEAVKHLHAVFLL